ncbi:GNAT family N-acetyltransferase [Anaerocolumna sedimenticola]|uniref:GNAT family N-acetyltransferase n=1 Tax=Anaerocolumna sedimenticola TaxID=2696063 RepID=A0A6P1TK17_9FIRM|nr:GNAT family N-acetyltransferase [Anaerocolumna sedimenticola]QHQ59985.1 GNAT family N-acetyltransferase [Anaerocolumna sedimenticola]
MNQIEQDQFIILKEFLTPKDCEDIKKLQEVCFTYDPVNLKLELDYKLSVPKHAEKGIKKITEFLYYANGVLVSYLGICMFGGNVPELNGMTHPEWRRRGLFTKLFSLALSELKRDNPEKLLLLTDENSESGKAFIQHISGIYGFSEYRMKYYAHNISELPPCGHPAIQLKTVEKSDIKEISRQNAIYFGTTEESEILAMDESMLTDGMYLVRLKDSSIGKIYVEYGENSAFIYGFGILPEFRRNGYGKAAFRAVMDIIKSKGIDDIQLDVESKNRNALNLYKSFGFQEMSVMNYFEYML